MRTYSNIVQELPHPMPWRHWFPRYRVTILGGSPAQLAAFLAVLAGAAVLLGVGR